jgi:hypothetical protein
VPGVAGLEEACPGCGLVALHLITLCLVVEEEADPSAGAKLHARLAHGAPIEWLEPPRPLGRLTVADVLAAGDAEEHARLVEAWARDVWAAWAPNDEAVRRLIRERLG